MAFINLIFAILLGISLAAIYLIPALTTQDNVLIKDIATKPFFYFANNFILGKPPIYPSFNLFIRYLGIVVICMATISYFAFVVAKKNPDKMVRQESFYWLAIAMVSTLMTIPASKPLWRLVSVLQIIQFPWRFLVILTVATTALTALSIHSFHENSSIWDRKKLSLLLGLLLVLIFSGFCLTFYNTRHLVFNSKTLVKMSQDAPEYRPKWVPETTFEQYLIQDISHNLPKAKIISGKGKLVIEKWQSRLIIIQTDGTTNIKVMLRQLYYPGWKAVLSNQLLTLKPSQQEGLLCIEIPRGQHQIKLILAAGANELIGQALSGVSALILILLAFCKPKPQRNKSHVYINQTRIIKVKN